MGKVIVVVGPTATGKTDLAVSICKKFNGEIISVDSRQAYREMNIGTGKSLGDGSIPIHLYDLVNPTERLNAYDYATYAWEKIEDFWSRGKLPFLVGGTGFYMDVILGHRILSGVGVDPKLRVGLEALSKEELAKRLSALDPQKLKTIDIHNKYRLVRAIEVLMQTKNSKTRDKSESPKVKIGGDWESLTIGLTSESSYLYNRADQRVNSMVEAGLVNEVKGLVKKYGWEVPGLNALGYRELKPYLESSIQLSEAVKKLKYDTHAYIRRQKTYFKKYFSSAYWFDISKPRFEEEVKSKVNLFLR